MIGTWKENTVWTFPIVGRKKLLTNEKCFYLVGQNGRVDPVLRMRIETQKYAADLWQNAAFCQGLWLLFRSKDLPLAHFRLMFSAHRFSKVQMRVDLWKTMNMVARHHTRIVYSAGLEDTGVPATLSEWWCFQPGTTLGKPLGGQKAVNEKQWLLLPVKL